MAFEMLIGLEVQDDKIYNNYREAMKPILDLFGGVIGYDFKIAEVLKPQSEGPINRVFTLNFPSKKEMEGFFSNEEYIEVKTKYFDKSVGNMLVISSYEK